MPLELTTSSQEMQERETGELLNKTKSLCQEHLVCKTNNPFFQQQQQKLQEKYQSGEEEKKRGRGL